MKVEKLQRILEREFQKDIADGYVRIDEYTILHDIDGNAIRVKGAYGRVAADGKVDFQYDLDLFYPDGTSIQFIKGMFYQQVLNNL